MKKVLLGVGIAALLLATSPSPVAAYSDANGGLTDFTLSPVAGPAGTTIHVSGFGCGPAGFKATVGQYTQVRSDVGVGFNGGTFTVHGPNGQFSSSMTAHFGSAFGTGVVDTNIRTDCPNLDIGDRPFAVGQPSSTAAPRIFTSLGNGQCSGFGGPIRPGPPPPPPANCPVHVKGFDDLGRLTTNFYANQRVPHAGGTIALGDALPNNEGPEVLTGSGPTQDIQGGVVNFATIDGTFLRNEIVYDGFKGGVRVASGDVTGLDDSDEVITAPGATGNSLIQIFNYGYGPQFQNRGYFYAYGPKFLGGVTVAVADVVGDARKEIITGAGPGGGPHVKVFDASGNTLGSFYAYGPNFTGGVTVSAGDFDGDGKAEIVTGTMGGGAPHVRTFKLDGTPVGPGFYAYDQHFTGGVWVAVGDVDRRGGNEIVTAPGVGGMPHVRVFTSPTGTFDSVGFYAYEGLATGVYVAVAP